ncbi:MAG TPA: DUF3883 domain-containing protein [Kaistia sp.]|nr:DUF3883 domain-containing protein [Kaistia sp.]
MATLLDDTTGIAPDPAPARPAKAAKHRAAARPAKQSVNEPDYVPPDFSASRQIRIGASFIEQFVAGHDAGDVLRELVQNEFDGGGDVLTLTFGSRSLEVIGSGRNIDARGWDRLSVIVGTGNVMGSGHGEVIAPKENGIGSKNFGLRSLFRFGDAIHVRSGGKVALLDLQTQETAHESDPSWRREKGVRIHVPYRQGSTDRLEAFTVEREEHALGLMAMSMADTLVKLSLTGQKQGLRQVHVNSIRTGRRLRWKQDAVAGRCRLVGVSMVARKGRLLDGKAAALFQEEEFSRSVDIPVEYRDRAFPAYYRVPGDRLKIAISVSIVRKRIDLQQHGHFHYPLKAPSSRTGCAISVSAPFELNTDRSGLIDHVWNDCLIDEAVALTIDLLKADWLARYGADAFKALIPNGPASPDRFTTKLAERLASEACWPTLAKGKDKFAAAKQMVLPTDEEYAGLLSAERYLDPLLAGDKDVCDLFACCGAKRFTIGSLVRLRCAGENSASLATKLKDEADYRFTNYAAALAGIDLQKRLAAALSAFPRRLTKQHKADLRNTASTLSATGALRPAAELMIVDPELWTDCPEPEDNRLHPDLVMYKAISDHCRSFDEERWLIDAAERAATAAPDNRERETLYRKLLAREAPISRTALNALRTNPVVKNQRGEWVAPADLVNLKRSMARFLDPVIDTPSKELLATPTLLARLRIRATINGTDLIRFAHGLADRPEMADRFEKLLGDHLKLLTASTVEALRNIACLKSRSGALAAPLSLHLDTPTNRLCLRDNGRIVGGTNELIYRKLKLKPAPDSETLLDILENHREEGTAPDRPDLLYPALVEAIGRERRSKSDLADRPICWVQNGYHAPSDILVGARIAAPLADVIPIYRYTDEAGRAYQDLGAPSAPNDSHWLRFFRAVGSEWAPTAPINQHRRRTLLEAYRLRGSLGLPTGLDDVRCLIDDRSRLFTLAELRAGQLVEPDFPPLQEALKAADSNIGVIETTERSRAFYVALGIRPLSAIAGASAPMMGEAGRAPFWFKTKLGDRVLAILHRPMFAWALSEVAYRSRHGHAGFVPSDLATIKARLAGIRSINFFQTLGRRYSVGGASVLVPAQLALDGERLGLVPPKNKTAFQLLLAEALAEIAGATSVATMRGIANAFLPLLLCGTQEELIDYLDMIGISHRCRIEEEDNLDLNFEDDDDATEDAEEMAVRQVFDDLNTDGPSNSEPVKPVDPPVQPRVTPTPIPVPPPPPSFQLPELDEVSLKVAKAKGTTIEPRQPGPRGGGSSGVWLPPTPEEVVRARRLGERGEALVYRMEIEKIRAMGYAEPERYVIWTSRDQPGADHDIRSIDADGRPRWLEVKSTTGSDGRFEWPRQEFEKALRERERYELWRVYRVAERNPTAKCFPNPASLLGTRQILLELAGLRANIEGIS